MKLPQGSDYHGSGKYYSKDNVVEVLTPYPKKRNSIERFLDRHNHFMEFVRTLIGIITVTLQLIILYRLSN